MNKNSFFIPLLTILCISTILFSCSSKKEISAIKIKKKTAKYILEATKKNTLDYEWISSKVSCSVSIKNKNSDLNLKLRMKKDSAIWLSISPALGIEMARVLITPDSLKYVNRIDKTYYNGSIKQLSSLAPVPVSFYMLQNFITGNQDLQSEKKQGEKKQNDGLPKFKASIDNNYYLLSTTNKKAHQKSIEGKKKKDPDASFYWISPTHFKFNKIVELNYSTMQKIIVEYDNYETIEGQLFPMLGTLIFEAISPLTLQLEYSRTELNNPQKFPFSISQKYERIH